MQIGEKLRELRIQRNLTQEELADRCELSKGFISQVERDIASPSIATLVDMLECLGSNLQTFFTDDSKEKLVFSPADMFEKPDDEEHHGKITWLVPTAQKNSMEPILLELEAGGETNVLPPHDGEEFGFVLAGRITLCANRREYTVKTGGSFCLRPSSTHSLRNTGKTKAKVLWVSTPPSF
ncbi:MAG TPA: cupin domain-containing protein [Candidatus Limiplasma sp.]|nr:cupin domain-containing protein [Candidatus Limiplasma sp.]HPS80850.1 cupin domain-containing protein [Candidatus Limiplasma sp.]